MFLFGSYILPSIEILFLIQSNKLEFNSLILVFKICEVINDVKFFVL